jgi:hypothetical protein
MEGAGRRATDLAALRQLALEALAKVGEDMGRLVEVALGLDLDLEVVETARRTRPCGRGGANENMNLPRIRWKSFAD